MKLVAWTLLLSFLPSQILAAALPTNVDTYSAQTIGGAKTFTGPVVIPTQPQGDSSTNAATTGYVDTGLAGKVDNSTFASYTSAKSSVSSSFDFIAGPNQTITSDNTAKTVTFGVYSSPTFSKVIAGDCVIGSGPWVDVRKFASIQAAIDYAASAKVTDVKDVRATSYTGPGWTVKSGVHFYAAPVDYTVSSSVVVNGGAWLVGASASNNNGTKFIAANGLNADVVRSDTVLGNLVSLVRSTNVVTATTVAPHGLTTGEKAAIINPANDSFEGSSTGVVVTVTGPTTFTYANAGADASSGEGGWIVKGDTVGWQWGVVENFRVNGNSANNTYGAGVHISFPCENAHVRHITVSDSPQDGVLISMAVAGAGDLTDWAVFSNKRYGVNLHLYENSVKVGLISGDYNVGPLLRASGGNTTSVTVGFIKSEVQGDVGGTKQDPVILLERRMGAYSTPSFSLLGGYAYGPPSSPKADIIRISSVSTWRVFVSNLMANYYTNAINDLARSVTIPLSYVDRKPSLVYSGGGIGMYAAGGTDIGMSNTSAITQTDANGTEKDIITADASDNTYIKPIGGNLYLQDAAAATYISFASNTINYFKNFYGTGSMYAGQFISSASNPSSVGTVRLAKGDTLRFRNNANSADITALSLSAEDTLQLSGPVSVATGGSAGKAICWKTDGKTLGYCSTAPDAAGTCTCN